ncbi:MAG: hypothetical protein GF355_16795 [Candidatus Eisenbacteria bacterium]|nr:hypothetical protein [Candidatus Eisenbacteria bacterium]
MPARPPAGSSSPSSPGSRGPVTENIPWAAPHSRVTHRFEHLMLSYCQLMTQKAAATLLRISLSTLSDLLQDFGSPDEIVQELLSLLGPLRRRPRFLGMRTVGSPSAKAASGTARTRCPIS